MRRAVGSLRCLATLANSSSAGPNSSLHPLVDSFGRFHNYLRISLTERCNLRCVYCMPKDGVQLTPSDRLMTLSERKRALDLFASLGVTKLRLTGGEPTVSKDLVDVVRHARSIPTIQSIGITTNGLTLTSQLDRLIEAGLTHVNISLDTLVPEKFARITRREALGIKRVLSSIYTASAKGLVVKVNCVLMRGVNHMEMKDFLHFVQDQPIDVRFIEVMPFDDNEWSPDKLLPYSEAIDMLRAQVRFEFR